jgi:hypothetical protein
MRHDWYTGSPHAAAAGASDALTARTGARASDTAAAPAADPGAPGARAAADPRSAAEPAAAGPRTDAAAAARRGAALGGPEAARVLGEAYVRGGQPQAGAPYDRAARAGQHRFEVQAGHLGQVVGES